MDCPDENRLLEYFQKVLPSDSVEAIEEHIDQCADCRALMADLARGDKNQTTPLQPGVRVDHFRIGRLLGRGGMGVVYLARDIQLGRKVALKVIRPDQLVEGAQSERFLSEAKTLARFSHPNIVTIYTVGEYGDQPYLAMEYLAGDTLQQRLGQIALGLKEAARVALSIARALREAHAAGVLHRDLKPANVMFSRDGRLRVVDFSLAKRIPSTELPVPEQDTELLDSEVEEQPTVCGTPAYMAPEQWLGQQVSAACDIWALGVILFEMITGHRPWAESEQSTPSLRARVLDQRPAPTPESWVGTLPPDMVELIAGCLDKTPEHRPTAETAVGSLKQWLKGSSRPAATVSASPFRGLLPFGEQHAAHFFGRDAEVTGFVEQLRETPLLAVIGASGVGKSSFVRAGVLPRLREQDRWQVMRMRPGADPFASLARSWLADASTTRRTTGAGESQDRGQLAADLRRSPQLLGLRLLERAEEEGCRILLLVDQLEEVFTLVDDQQTRESFISAICGAADDTQDPVRVVLALRDDFVVPLTRFAVARRALREVFVLHTPEPEQLREVLVKPLEAVDYGYDGPDLIDRMVTEVTGATAGLPLLQFALQKVWERRDVENRLLRREAFDAIGGVGGALALHGDGVLERLSSTELDLARQLLLRLVTPAATRAVLTETELLDGLDSEAESVLARLADARLISVRRGATTREVELAHESLIVSWRRLVNWIERGREDLRFLDEINQAAQLWQTRGERDEELWSGDALHEAQAAARRLSTPMPGRAERFLRAASNRAQRQSRRSRRLLVVSSIALALLAVASAVTALSFSEQKQRAEQGRRAAERRHAQALRVSARAAHARRELAEARAQLRTSLEIEDSLAGRALYWQLQHDPLRFRRTLGAKVHDVAFSADGTRFAVAAQDQSIYLFDRRTLSVRILRGHDDQVFAVAFSPGDLLASGDWSGQVRLWDLKRGTVKVLRGHSAAVWRLRFSPDGTLLASSSWDGTVRLWSGGASGEARVLKDHKGRVYGVGFSKDGRLLASGGDDSVVRLWDVASGVVQRRLGGHTGRIYDVAFGEDSTLASAGADRTVRLWRVDDPAGKAHVLRGHRAGVYSVAFGPDGSIASGSWDKTVRLWPSQRSAAHKARVLREHEAGIYSIVFSPDGKLLLSGGADDTVCGWDLQTAQPPVAEGHQGQAWGVAFSPDGRRIASSGRDKTVRLWDVASGKQLASLEGHVGLVTALSFSPDGKLLASASADKSVLLWRMDALGKHRRLVRLGAAIYGVAFSPDGRVVASGSSDGAVRLWDVSTGKLVRALDGHEAGVWDLAFSPDGARLASASADQTIRVWSVATGRSERVLAGHHGTVYGVAFDPEGKRVASAGSDGTVRLWQLTTGEGRELSRRQGRAYFLHWSAGNQIGVPGSDGVGRIRPIAGGPEIVLRGHRGELNCLRFSPDGKLVATAGDDGTVRLWDAHSGRPRWHASALLPSPPTLYSHRGQRRLSEKGKVVRTMSAVERAISRSRRARRAATAGAPVCLQAFDGHLQGWDIAGDQPLFEDRVPGLRDVAALAVGCAALSESEVRIYGRDGAFKVLTKDPTALAIAGRQLLVATARAIEFYDATNSRKQSQHKANGKISALSRIKQWLVVGYTDGNIELMSSDGRVVRTLQSSNSSPVVSLLQGPPGSVIAGHADGTVVIWQTASGQRLIQRRLHGAIEHLLFNSPTLYVASTLGDHLSLDLTTLVLDRCSLLRQLWRDTAVAWHNGALSLRPPPARHDCRRN